MRRINSAKRAHIVACMNRLDGTSPPVSPCAVLLTMGRRVARGIAFGIRRGSKR